jgi:hypothetical protein
MQTLKTRSSNAAGEANEYRHPYRATRRGD